MLHKETVILKILKRWSDSIPAIFFASLFEKSSLYQNLLHEIQGFPEQIIAPAGLGYTIEEWTTSFAKSKRRVLPFLYKPERYSGFGK
ncbi:MAG: hypothetical protein RIT43_657 [Bacteroidota bacterium]|jgi:hypothetical protein